MAEVTVFECDDRGAVSESGVPVHHGDVAHRLKKMLTSSSQR